ncbi:MAG TPA: glycosyltransferase family 2 protein, partial [Lysobacter sp.]|nr:glycosyltransferase family 2 protein [Lysobacter sp.]
MISFIVPAHDEQRLIADTLEAIHAAACGVGLGIERDYEIVVVDDASTDRTAEIAIDHGARVVHVSHRQIAATRNAGAREARGDFLFFIDADTLIHP